jgi:hypothetical protein
MSMIVTPWKVFVEESGTYRIRAKYGLDYDFARRHKQPAYFSVTAEIERKDPSRPHHWREDAGGMLHDEVARHFRSLAPYIKWHLVGEDGPMHYIENAKYWWEMATGTGKWERRPSDPDPESAFRNTVVLGALSGDVMPPKTTPWSEVKLVLEGRLPDLMKAWASDMKALQVLE